VESQNDPKVEEVPDLRAIAPSIMSEKTKAVITSVPTSSSPRG
jgi:hypothetical protein